MWYFLIVSLWSMIFASSSKYFSSLHISLKSYQGPYGTLFFCFQRCAELKYRYCLLSVGLWYSLVSI